MKLSFEKTCHFILGLLWSAIVTSPLFSLSEDNRVKQFYEATHNQFVWIKDGKLTNCGNILLHTLQNADQEGLNPEIYSTILQTIQQIPNSTLENQRQIDRWLTFAALTYIAAIKGDRLNLSKVDKDISLIRPPINEVERLAGFLQTDNTCSWLKTLPPTHPQYQFLKTLLALYKFKQKTSNWPQIPTKTHLRQGDKDPIIPNIIALLKDQDIPLGTSSDSTFFDENLATAIQYYQRTHGLDPNGKIDTPTVKVLNTSIDERIKQIIVTMERYRWLPTALGDRYIFVNIAGFYLQAVEDTKTAFYMPVIIGKHYRETPIFNAPMTDIIFNPTWHVPHKIATQDKLPLLKKNPDALSKKGYRFYDQDGQEVSPSSINWSSLSPSNFPYRLNQDPGPFNALGKIRFTLQNNPFSIYLHGTPDQDLFNKTSRSLSSGCVRVENPIKLAEFVLKDPIKWPLSAIEKAASGTLTKNIKLPISLPVYIAYFTVWKDEYGHTHFMKDIYGQDHQIWEALVKADKSELEKISSHSTELSTLD